MDARTAGAETCSSEPYRPEAGQYQSFGTTGCCVGYPSPDRPAKVKRQLPQQAVLHHEAYSAAGEVRLSESSPTIRRKTIAKMITWIVSRLGLLSLRLCGSREVWR